MDQSISTVDEYIAGFEEPVQTLLRQVRQTIREVVPEAEETIKYAMPTYVLFGNLVHFAGYKHHIGFYPAPAGITHFKEELSVYKNAKGSVQFPIDQPMPLDLIRRIVAFRVQDNLGRMASRKTKKA